MTFCHFYCILFLDPVHTYNKRWKSLGDISEDVHHMCKSVIIFLCLKVTLGQWDLFLYQDEPSQHYFTTLRSTFAFWEQGTSWICLFQDMESATLKEPLFIRKNNIKILGIEMHTLLFISTGVKLTHSNDKSLKMHIF